MLRLVIDIVENIVGKGENAGDQHFLLFPQLLSKSLFIRIVKTQLNYVGKSLRWAWKTNNGQKSYHANNSIKQLKITK